MKMYPSYLNLSKKEFKKRIEKSFKLLENCRLCPRECGVERLRGELGFCGLKELPMISAYHPHFGEEKVLVGEFGSGTIFFSHFIITIFGIWHININYPI